ncbi:CWC23 [Candida pseudojiufengensis]|uniref:CWC23 n=1 Tax=Candida pseudojiufengensis TaxID=497109 RepID=UPI002224E672|nr:CWC23 [Candida pseudojiufengensis]KAI5962083.1 CWC23 [Candida pseudojiufengensis]
MDKLIPKIIKDDIDLYKVLDLSINSSTERLFITSQEIRDAYKKQALIHHPDKQQNQNSDNKFELILTSFQILSTPELKQQYDSLIDLKNQKLANSSKLNELILKFQNDLLSNESKNLNERQNRSKFQNLDQLREDGLKRRRIHETSKLAHTTHDTVTTTVHNLPLSDFVDFKNYKIQTPDSFSARLKYKFKPNLNVSEDILIEIMSLFGPIKSLVINDHDDRYSYATIEYLDEKSLNNAISYDYSSASKWDGTRVRKLASLLRSCEKIVHQQDPLPSGDKSIKWTNNDYVNEILNTYYVNSVSDKKI